MSARPPKTMDEMELSEELWEEWYEEEVQNSLIKEALCNHFLEVRDTLNREC